MRCHADGKKENFDGKKECKVCKLPSSTIRFQCHFPERNQFHLYPMKLIKNKKKMLYNVSIEFIQFQSHCYRSSERWGKSDRKRGGSERKRANLWHVWRYYS